jgi:hypothetical protein
MNKIRSSTVLMLMAARALAGALVLIRIDEASNSLRFDSLSAVLLFAVLPVTALAGLINSAVLLFKDRSTIRWVELALSAAFLVFFSLEH